jgi:vacuolar-type H+-ATPase subunit H
VIENDFKRKLQEHVAQLDSEKATFLAQLEKELNVRQEIILESARKRIDDLNEEANRLKLVSQTYISFYFK